MTCACQAKPYEGRADHVWPPHTLGWAEVPYAHDAGVREKARMMLGSLPVYHYADEALEQGLYRFFKYETPIGEAVGALKFVGEERATELLHLGQGPGTVEAWVDSQGSATGAVTLDGNAIPEDNSTISSSATNSGIQVTPVAYATLQAAATAMYNAILAHGYRRLDQAIYAGYQLKAGTLTVDAFPGTNTMGSLRTTLASMGTTMSSSIPIYPWRATTASGATGQAAYDGVNAPTWAQWTGQGTAPTVSAATAAAGSGALLATLATAAVVVGGLIAKSAGAF